MENELEDMHKAIIKTFENIMETVSFQAHSITIEEDTFNGGVIMYALDKEKHSMGYVWHVSENGQVVAGV